ncbi:carboxymuconolactone decarboxylase family protein [Glycomyces tenuis]|uniref:carboxymuconolactone decarboxylase family protein n=1 Tax=Glycomyces tenuis TaxID=58116 RepID=UPI000423F6BE|nr:carboxymuconolactone decarboxylase family protein [Glycomyces tenuis]
MTIRLNPAEVETLPKIWKALAAAGKPMQSQDLVPRSTLELVNLRASQINGCSFCTDMHTKDMAHAGEQAERIAMVAAWREAPYFTEPERAALLLAEEATRIADGDTGVSDEVWAEVRKHYDENQAAVLIGQIAMTNAWNRFNVILQNPAGNYTPGQWG